MDEIKIFDECLNRTYNDEFYKPVLEVIYNIVSKYNDYLDMLRNHNVCTNNGEREEMVIEFIDSLFGLMRKLINDNKYQHLNHDYAFLNKDIEIHDYAYVDYLELFYYKEETFNKNKEEFYNRFHELCDTIYHLSETTIYPHEFASYVNRVNKFRTTFEKAFKDLTTGYYVVEDYVDKLAAYAYVHNIPDSHLLNMFSCLMSNASSIDDYIHQNYNFREYFQLECNVIDKIIGMSEGEKGVIR